MTVEIHAKWITLLAEVDELKSKEAALKSEKQRHLEQIAQSEGEVSRCSDELILRLSKRDSMGGFPNRRVSDSRWRAREVRHAHSTSG
jgi:hypothetical protein